MSNFSNTQLQVGELPDIETVIYEPLAPKYIYVLLIERCIGLLMYLAAGFMLNYFFGRIEVDIPSKYIYIVSFIVGLIPVLMTYKAYQRKSYALREHDLSFQSGFLLHRLQVMPLRKVQHCEIHKGMFDQLFNIARLRLYSADSGSSDLEIPGLHDSTAQKLKQHILEYLQHNV